MKKNIIFIFLIIGVTACSVYNNFDKLFYKADKFYNEGNYYDAVSVLKKLNLNNEIITKKIAYCYYFVNEIDSSLVWLKKTENINPSIKNKIDYQALIAIKILNSYYRNNLTFLNYIIKKSIEINVDPSFLLSIFSTLKENENFEINKNKIDSLIVFIDSEIPKYQENYKSYNLEKLLTDWFCVSDSISLYENEKIKKFIDDYKKYRYKKNKFHIIEKEILPDSEYNLFESEGYAFDISNLISIDSLKAVYKKNRNSDLLPNLALIAEVINAYDIADEIYRNMTSNNNMIFMKNAALFYIKMNDKEEIERYLTALSFTNKKKYVNRLRFYQKIINGDFKHAEIILENNNFNELDRFNMEFLFYVAKKDSLCKKYTNILNDDNPSLLSLNLLNYPEVYPFFFVSSLTPLNKVYKNKFNWPLKKIRITSRFGWRPNPKYFNWIKRLEKMDFHYGIDLGGKIGTPVYSIGAGKVVRTDTLKYAGKYIKIEHTNGFSSVYFHLHKICVEKGDSLSVNSKIGEVGNSGRSFGPHLHLGIFNENGKSINPEMILPD